MTVIDEWMQTAATSRGDAVYLCDATGRRTLTYAGLRSAARAWGALLDRVGVPPGGAVAIRLADPLGYATALVGIVGAGRVAVPLDPGAPAAELSRVLAVAQPQTCVCDSGWDLPPRLTLLGAPKAGASQVAVSSHDGGIFLCTSGTTGTPKGILLREDQLSHVAASVAAHHQLTPADRGYCCLPLFHVNAEVVGLLATLAAGAGLVLDRKFSRRGFWELMEQQRITWINAVPAIIAVLAMSPPPVPAAVPPAVPATVPPAVRPAVP